MDAEILDWASPFALVRPLNQSAQSILDSRPNRLMVRRASLRLMATRHTLRERGWIDEAMLSFGMLYGRRCLTFGTSGSAAFRLAQGEGISYYQFFIQFDSVGALLLYDCSRTGTWVRPGVHPLQPYRLLHHSRFPLTADVDIRIGEVGHEFRISPGRLMDDPTMLLRLFNKYTESIAGSLPRPASLVKRCETVPKRARPTPSAQQVSHPARPAKRPRAHHDPAAACSVLPPDGARD